MYASPHGRVMNPVPAAWVSGAAAGANQQQPFFAAQQAAGGGWRGGASGGGHAGQNNNNFAGNADGAMLPMLDFKEW